MDRLYWYANALRNLGISSLIRLQIQKLWLRVKRGAHAKLTSKYARFPLLCRPRTNDLAVFHQIFVDREYRCLDHLKQAEYILDCGANVGYSSAYFLTAFPDAKLVAIEPDSENFALLKKNLAPYGDRAMAVKAAVWSHPTTLTFESNTLEEGQEWGRQVKTADIGEEALVQAIDIGSILDQFGFEKISILKMDIEGAEANVFASNYGEWMEKVESMIIEIHGKRCREVFQSAIDGQGFSVSVCDELTVCQR